MSYIIRRPILLFASRASPVKSYGAPLPSWGGGTPGGTPFEVFLIIH
jgi:hypothetical protein